MVDLGTSGTILLSEETDGLERLGSLLAMDLHRTRNYEESVFKKIKEQFNFDDYFNAVEARSTNIRREIEEYWLVLKNIPMAAMVVFCIEKSVSKDVGNNFNRFLYLQGIQRLWVARLLPVDHDGKHRLLGDLHPNEHLLVIENIRCVKEWSVSEKEELIACYLQFTYDLARVTFGMIQVAFDPDRLKVERKVIRYEVFMNFAQLLPERDALIAKLLYFGAPTVESVVSLKIEALDMEKLEIQFGERVVRFPKHVMQDIAAHIQPRKEAPNSLVFVNVRGEEVDRVHLNQAFARKSANLPGGFKITPAILLKII